ncbi:MAG: small multi-drug export protein [Candidatus Syntropharchaeales archaeon]
MLLVTTPLQGTGAVAGSVIGRLMGMTPLRTWLAVTLGITFRTALTTLIVLGIISLL